MIINVIRVFVGKRSMIWVCERCREVREVRHKASSKRKEKMEAKEQEHDK